MFKRFLTSLGAVGALAGALMLSPGTALAQHGHGGGHGGGGHVSSGHAGGFHGGSFHGANASAFHGGAWHGGAWHGGTWHGGNWAGRGWYGRYPYWGRYGGYGWRYPGLYAGLWGWGYPWYYGYGDGYYPSYYASEPAYYYDSTPLYDYTAPYNYGAYNAPGETYGPASPNVAEQNVANLRIIVPPDAQVWMEGQLTPETGPARTFVTPELQPGRPYGYDITAQWYENGQEVTRMTHVVFRAGNLVTVDFTKPTTAVSVTPGV